MRMIDVRVWDIGRILEAVNCEIVEVYLQPGSTPVHPSQLDPSARGRFELRDYLASNLLLESLAVEVENDSADCPKHN